MSTGAVWLNSARYGMFVHWGAVGERGEWFRERIPQHEYAARYADNFRVEVYDPTALFRKRAP